METLRDRKQAPGTCRFSLLALVVLAMIASLSGCERGPPAPPRAPPLDVVAVLAEAAALTGRGYHVDAAHLLSRSAEAPRASQAERALLRLRAARSYLDAGVPDLSLKSARKAQELGLSDPELLYVLGDAERRLNEPEAEATLLKLLAAAPGHKEGTLALARLRSLASDPAAALDLFERYFALSGQPRESESDPVLRDYARALQRAGRHQEAADWLALLLERDPMSGEDYAALAQALYRLRLRDEARFVEAIYKDVTRNAFEEHVEDRLRETGNTAMALGQQGANLLWQKRFLGAIRAFREALALDATEPRFRTYYADVCIQLLRLSEARELLQAAIARGLEPSSGLQWMLGRVELEAERPAEALQSFEKAAKALAREGDLGGEDKAQAPRASLALARARAGVESGGLDAAERALGEAAAAGAQGWEVALWGGRLLLERGDAAGALQRFAAARSGGAAGLWDLDAWTARALERAGRAGQARGVLEEALERKPSDVGTLEVLARLTEAGPAREAATRRLRAAEELLGRIQTARGRVDSTPLEEAGSAYLELGGAFLEAKDPRGFDLLFLAADLLPRDVQSRRRLVMGLQGPKDVFLRLRLLRQILEIDPESEDVASGVVDIYAKLHLRLGEVEKLARGLLERFPSARSHRLLGLVLSRRGDVAGARSIVEEGLRRYPGDEALSKLGATLPKP